MIPVCEPLLTGKEMEFVRDCLETNWISSMGKYIPMFEERFAAFCGATRAVACCNGTAALHLALAALGVGRGDEVILPSFTMVATLNAVLYTGATPVLADSELDTWNMDIDAVRQKITSRTRAIIAVHTYGHPVDMDPLMELAARHGINVVEDAAEAHGAEYKTRRAGSLGHIAAFSFYSNKIITTGEGGMVVTGDAALADRAASLRNHCFGVPRFVHHEMGFNYRMTNIQAAIGCAQMEQADMLVESRIRVARQYQDKLRDMPGLTLPPQAHWAKNVYWMFGILLKDDFGCSMPELQEALRKRGVETRAFFAPMNRQPFFQEQMRETGQDPDSFPNADRLGKNGLYLPSGSGLTEKQIETVAAALGHVREETKP
jgi:perosamine synthetase